MSKISNIKEELIRIKANATKLLNAVEKENKKCELTISKDLNELKYIKITFINNVLTLSKKILGSLQQRNYKYQADFKYPDIKINIKDEFLKEEDKLSKGIFQKISITIFTFISILYTFIIISSSKIGLILIPMQLPTYQQHYKMFEWVGNLIYQDPELSYNIGIASVFILILIINYFLIYIYTLYLINKNLKISTTRLALIEDYASQKYECRVNTKKISVLLKKTITLIKKYTILMNEFNASFQRIIFIEKDKIKFHPNSEKIIDNLYQLVLSIDILLRIPIENDDLGKLFKEKLEKSDKVYEEIVSKIYN